MVPSRSSSGTASVVASPAGFQLLQVSNSWYITGLEPWKITIFYGWIIQKQASSCSIAIVFPKLAELGPKLPFEPPTSSETMSHSSPMQMEQARPSRTSFHRSIFCVCTRVSSKRSKRSRIALTGYLGRLGPSLHVTPARWGISANTHLVGDVWKLEHLSSPWKVRPRRCSRQGSDDTLWDSKSWVSETACAIDQAALPDLSI